MVKIIVKFKILPGVEDEYLPALKKCILATREEPGCIEYTAFWNKEDRILTLFEGYNDSEAAARHIEYPHFAVDFKALKKFYDGKAIVERFEDEIV